MGEGSSVELIERRRIFHAVTFSSLASIHSFYPSTLLPHLYPHFNVMACCLYCECTLFLLFGTDLLILARPYSFLSFTLSLIPSFHKLWHAVFIVSVSHFHTSNTN